MIKRENRHFVSHMLMACLIVLTAWTPGVADPAGRGNDPYTWIHAGGYDTPGKVLYDQYSFEWTWGPSPVVGTAYALGDVRTDETALARAASQIHYHDPYGTGHLTIGADVGAWKPFVVTSETIDEGTEVPVTLLIGYDGTLQALEGMEGKHSYAQASGELTLYADDETKLAYRSGQAKVDCGLESGNWSFTTESTGDWTGLLAVGTDLSGDPVYALDYSDQIEFTATVGERYWLYFDLATSAYSSAGDAAGWEGSATFARADFSDTGSYQLMSTADVSFVMVPEPATMMLFALAGIAVLRRRI